MSTILLSGADHGGRTVNADAASEHLLLPSQSEGMVQVYSVHRHEAEVDIAHFIGEMDAKSASRLPGSEVIAL
jgi:hypothetical protein